MSNQEENHHICDSPEKYNKILTVLIQTIENQNDHIKELRAKKQYERTALQKMAAKRAAAASKDKRRLFAKK